MCQLPDLQPGAVVWYLRSVLFIMNFVNLRFYLSCFKPQINRVINQPRIESSKYPFKLNVPYESYRLVNEKFIAGREIYDYVCLNSMSLGAFCWGFFGVFNVMSTLWHWIHRRQTNPPLNPQGLVISTLQQRLSPPSTLPASVSSSSSSCFK